MPATQKWQMRSRKQDKARLERLAAKARRRCTDAVWARAEGFCEDCGMGLLRWAEPESARSGHVHERRARSLGGDETDPSQCLLLCRGCHFNGPSGAHRASERPSA